MPGTVVTSLLTPEESALNETRKAALIELFKAGEPVLIVGSGVSSRLGYPTWDELLNSLEEFTVERETEAGKSLDRAANASNPLLFADALKARIEHCTGDLVQYHDFLGRTFEPRQIDTFHRQLVALPCRGILTSNYDSSLEQALAEVAVAEGHLEWAMEPFFVVGDKSARRVSEFLESISLHRGVPRRVAHLHGRYEPPSSIILTEGDYRSTYDARFHSSHVSELRRLLSLPIDNPDAVIEQFERRLPDWTLHRKLLWTILATRRAVFVGFGMTDPYLKRMLDSVANDLCRWGTSLAGQAYHFAVMPISEQDSEDTKLREKGWLRKAGVDAVFYENRNGQNHAGLADFISELATACRTRAYERVSSGTVPTPIITGPAPARPTNSFADLNRRMRERVRRDENTA